MMWCGPLPVSYTHLISAVTPADSHDPVIYPIGIIKKYDNALAKDFYQYVMSPEGQKVLEKYGFSTSK